MCILNFNLESFLVKTKKKLMSLKRRFFNFFPCMRKKRRDSNNVYFMNPLYDPNFTKTHELKEVVVIPNTQTIVEEQPKRENPFDEKDYYDINSDNVLENDLFSEGSMSDYDNPIFYESEEEGRKESIYNLIPKDTQPIYENLTNFITEIEENNNLERFTTKVEQNENMKFRDMVFKKIQDRRISYDKSLVDIPEDSSINYSTYTNDFESETESEISEHISPESDKYFDDNFDKNSEYNFDENSIDNLEEQWNHKMSQSKISIRSVDMNEDNNDSSEDNWDVLSN